MEKASPTKENESEIPDAELNSDWKKMEIDVFLRAQETAACEEKYRLLSDELTRVNQEMESLAYSVSHDLRAPLRALDGFSQALLEDYPKLLDDTGKDYLNRISASAKRMGQLIDGLLNLSNVTRASMRFTVINLTDIVKEITLELRLSAPERQAIFSLQEGVSAFGDAALVKIAIENLLLNAWKFTGKKNQARIEFSSTGGLDCPTYTIRDNGAGFDMNCAAKLFGAFQRLHHASEFPGTGIGLATVKRIIHRHGGQIWVESEPGHGTAFHFTLKRGA